MNKHTPGPWVMEAPPPDAYTDPDLNLDSDVAAWVSDSRGAGEVLAQVLKTSWREQDANAHLIAASPELLAALEQAERVMTDADLDHEPSDDPARVALETVRAAIAKAKGRS